MVSEPVEIDHSQSLLSGLISKTFEKLAADGAQTTPTITTGLSGPNGIAVDAAGKIHVTNSGYDDVTTYNPDGTQTTTTIGIYDTLAFPPRLSPPSSIAVDAAGKIYVVSLSPGQGSGPYWMLTTYNPDGLFTNPTFSQPDAGLGWSCVAVGTNKIFIGVEAQSGSVMTLNADGTGTPTYVTAGLSEPTGIAVDAAGKIYVTNGSSPGNSDKVTTYKPDGTQTTPTITAGLNMPSGVAVDAAGKNLRPELLSL